MRALISAMTLAGFMQFTADANTAGDQISATTSASPITIAPSCELHVFPTKEIFDDSYHRDSGVYVGGLLTNVIANAVVSSIVSSQNAHLAKDKPRAEALAQLPSYLAPDEQTKALEKANILATLKLPANTKIIQEGVLPAPFGETPKEPEQAKIYKQYWAAIHKGAPIAVTTPTTVNTCYRELIVSSITIKKGGNSFKLLSAFVYRTFDKNLSESGLYDGENGVLKPDAFPAQSEDKIAEASTAIQTAFSDNFSAWVERRVKFK
ncbi:MAG TPA: hypothetical protein VN222_09250 [Novosphingobium sp.]|nr:hypothetical protein [Novosphingobium sp.]